MKELIRNFKALCIRHGFSVNKRFSFSRCIGDGIFQSISIASFDFLNCDTDEYKAGRIKDRCIEIGIFSMYSNLPKSHFEDSRHIGNYFPENFFGESHNLETFYGFENEVRMMETKVFQVLDSIVTQEKLLELEYYLQKARYKTRLANCVFLCEPHVLCNEKMEALNHLYGYYTQNWIAFHSLYDSLKEAGDYQAYFEKERVQVEKMSYYLNFLKLLWGNKDIEINREMYHCLVRNIELAKQNHIMFGNSFHPKLEERDS